MTVTDLRCDECGRRLSGPSPAPALVAPPPGAGPGGGSADIPAAGGGPQGGGGADIPAAGGGPQGGGGADIPAAGGGPQGGGGAAAAAVRLSYHPGEASLRDDATLVCQACWDRLRARFGPPRHGVCAVCGEQVPWRASLHLRRWEQPEGWQLCRRHTVEWLNTLRTVEPKLDLDGFRFPTAPG